MSEFSTFASDSNAVLSADWNWHPQHPGGCWWDKAGKYLLFNKNGVEGNCQHFSNRHIIDTITICKKHGICTSASTQEELSKCTGNAI